MPCAINVAAAAPAIAHPNTQTNSKSNTILLIAATAVAISGVLLSPIARSIDAKLLYTITIGIPENRIRRYRIVFGRMSSGVCKTVRTGRTANWNSIVSTTARIADSTILCPTVCRSPSSSFAPNFCAI